jgi:hypothetical protein
MDAVKNYVEFQANKAYVFSQFHRPRHNSGLFTRQSGEENCKG